jgi:hypothetical protein
MATYKNIHITKYFLNNNVTSYFVYGDNLERTGYGGAAVLRDHPHALGFITKKFPDNNDTSFYTPEEYAPIFFEELRKLQQIVDKHPTKTFYISKLGQGLANRYEIWERIIHTNLVRDLEKFDNVVFCWNKDEKI